MGAFRRQYLPDPRVTLRNFLSYFRGAGIPGATIAPATEATKAPDPDAPTCDTCQRVLIYGGDQRAWHASEPLTVEQPIGKAPKPGSKRKQKTRTVVVAHHATCRACRRAREQRILLGTPARDATGQPILGYGVTVRRNPTTKQYEPYDRAAAMATRAGLDGAPDARRRRHSEGLLAQIKPKRMRGCRLVDPKPAAPFERLPAELRRAILDRQRAAAEPTARSMFRSLMHRSAA